MTRWQLINLVLCFPLLFGCQGSSSDSLIKHQWHKLHRDRSDVTRGSCEQKNYDNQDKMGEVRNDIIQYTSKVAQHLVEATHQSELEDNLTLTPFDFDSLCFDATNQVGKLNAFARPLTREITFELGAIELAKNDAQVAAIMAHEMAHVLMTHVGKLPEEISNLKFSKEERLQSIGVTCTNTGNLFSGLDFMTKAFPDEIELIQGLRQLSISQSFLYIKALFFGYSPLQKLEFCQIAEDAIQLNKKILQAVETKKPKGSQQTWNDLYSQKKLALDEKTLQEAIAESKYIQIEIEKALGYGPGALKNWQEQEADEVGFEIYIRAGFDPTEYDWIHEYALNRSRPEALSQCLKEISDGIIPNRASATHPTSCYRIYEVTKREPDAHKNEYGKLFPKAKTLELFAGELKSIQEKLSSLPKDKVTSGSQKNKQEDKKKPKTIPGKSIEEGVYTIQNFGNNEFLQVQWGLTRPGTNVSTWRDVADRKHGQWKIDRLDNGYYTIRALHSDHYLNVNYGGGSGTSVSAYPGLKSKSFAQWHIRGLGDSYYEISAKHSGDFLQAKSNDRGADALVRSNQGTKRARWILEKK